MSISEAAQTHLSRIYDLLIATYGQPEWRPDNDPLGGLVGTILSQHTSDINSERAYQQLITRFPTWEEVRDAPTDEVAEAIRSGGLAKIKAPRIQQALHILTGWREEKGSPQSLAAFLHDELMQLPLEDAWKYLQRIPGVGPKTAACVLLFNLGRSISPIDTHVFRICRRLGLISEKTSADQAHLVLLRNLPPEWAYPFHVHLIRHGRTVCQAQRPKCNSCPLFMECAYAGNADVQVAALSI